MILPVKATPCFKTFELENMERHQQIDHPGVHFTSSFLLFQVAVRRPLDP